MEAIEPLLLAAGDGAAAPLVAAGAGAEGRGAAAAEGATAAVCEAPSGVAAPDCSGVTEEEGGFAATGLASSDPSPNEALGFRGGIRPDDVAGITFGTNAGTSLGLRALSPVGS